MSYPLVEVEWVDAWYDPDEMRLSEFKPSYSVTTVGYLSRDEEDVVSVSQEALEDEDTFRATTHIPRALVVSITPLNREETTEIETSPISENQEPARRRPFAEGG